MSEWVSSADSLQTQIQLRAEVWRGQKKKKGRKRQFKNIPAGASERENPPIQLMRAAINRFRLSDVFNCQIQNDDVFV